MRPEVEAVAEAGFGGEVARVRRVRFQREFQFAGRADVQAEAFLLYPVSDGPAQVGATGSGAA